MVHPAEKRPSRRPVAMVAPDLQWLIDLCRHDLGGEAAAYPQDVDVDSVAALAEAHRVSVIADRSWRALARTAAVPEPPPSLQDAAARGRRQSFVAAAHLVRLAQAFAAEGVPWVALKGPALSVLLYGDATIRIARDLDIIVPPDRWDPAIRIAAPLGWIAPERWSQLMRITGRYDMELRPSLQRQPLLELHRSLGPPYTQFHLDPFASGVTAPVHVMETAVPAFTNAALATYVAWHGARGLWYRLAWLLDYARLLPRTDSEAADLLAMARSCKAECAVRAGALLAQQLFGLEPAPFPAASSSMAARVDRVLAWAIQCLRLGVDAPRAWSPPGSYVWFWREVAQQDDVWRSAAAAIDQYLRPTARDAEQLGLGVPVAVHRLARPAFLASRLFRRS